MLALMWDDGRGFFFDYDFRNQRRSTYISATGLYPLWAKMLDAKNPEDLQRAKRAAAFACAKLEQPAGLAATAKESVESARRQDGRQWDYPYGWAPHQMLAWQGFKNYGLDTDAGRLAYRWLYTIAQTRTTTAAWSRKNTMSSPARTTCSWNTATSAQNFPTSLGGVRLDGRPSETGIHYLSAARLTDLRALKPPPAK